jgi:transcriptional regulator with XRE-family HTH domain
MVIFCFDLFMAKKKDQSKKTVKDKYISNLGIRIKSLRIKKGYTNFEHFAYDNNFARTQYLRYEKGEDMRFSTLIKLIQAFEMTPEEFFSEGF